MKLLVTGAWRATAEQLQQLREMGHDLILQQQESDPLVCNYEEIEGTICNGLFLYHPIEKFPSLRYIQLTSAGFDRVPMDYVKAHSIEIHNARGVYNIPMAEHALAGVLSLYRHIGDFRDYQHQSKWQKLRNLEELFGQNVLVVGCGNIGTEVAKRFAAMGCKVSGVDVCPMPDKYPFDKVYPIYMMDDFLPSAHILVLTVPLTEDTRNLMDARRLSLLQDRSVLVNISRGKVVDQEALIRELQTGRLRAVLDVFEEEPLDSSSSPLWQLDNVVLTPHVSFIGDGNSRRIFDTIRSDLERLQ